ncbi:MAG: LL-diaminopimelate aminotransferase [bacterium]|nr:LL-diaminopimelate aminotransferase [bacterium]
MAKLNDNFRQMESYNTFNTVSEKINDYKKIYPSVELLDLGVGDVTRPIIKSVIKSMENAVEELSKEETFKGYGAPHGYSFLKEAIIKHEYKMFSQDEIYISSGTKTDITNILELFARDSKICVFNPMYPIYNEVCKLNGLNIHVEDASEEHNFVPQIPHKKYDIIYLCSPCNPTGVALSKEQLTNFVNYAKEYNAIILYDNVYENFITSNNVPKSIYEIEDAKYVAIEFRSFSKRISFSGVRCSYYVIPNTLQLDKLKGNINELWKKRVILKFNGADYIAQKGAASSYTQDAKKEISENISYYLTNAKMLKEALEELNFIVYGGVDSPYLWVKTKNNLSSWQYFYFLLEELNIIVIPGVIFGSGGENYIRISALGNKKTISKSIKKLRAYYAKKED